jgi:hypothetical protein
MSAEARRAATARLPVPEEYRDLLGQSIPSGGRPSRRGGTLQTSAPPPPVGRGLDLPAPGAGLDSSRLDELLEPLQVALDLL